jgi:hypothetical protein
MEVIKLNEDQLASLLFNQFFSKLIVSIEEVSKTLSSTKSLPLVLTNEDLKREFQISDTTLNRLINLSDFPPCWYGIRGHYSKEAVLKWYQQTEYEEFRKKVQQLRAM